MLRFFLAYFNYQAAFLVVTNKLPGYFTKPDKWHLGLKLDVSQLNRAFVGMS